MTKTVCTFLLGANIQTKFLVGEAAQSVFISNGRSADVTYYSVACCLHDFFDVPRSANGAVAKRGLQEQQEIDKRSKHGKAEQDRLRGGHKESI